MTSVLLPIPTAASSEQSEYIRMSGPAVLWTIWDSRNKSCSFLASKLGFSGRKMTGLHTPHFCASKEEQVSTRASGKYPVRSFPVQVIFLGLFSYPWQKLFHIAMLISPKQLFGCEDIYEYQKYFLWVSGFLPPLPSHVHLFSRLWSMSLWVLHIQKQLFVCFKFQPFSLLLLFPTYNPYPEYLED